MSDLFTLTNDIKSIGEQAITSLINQLGKSCLVVSNSSSVQQCPNCYFDTANQRSSGQYNGTGGKSFIFGTKCPVCHGTGYNPGTETTSVVVQLLLNWQPKVSEIIESTIEVPQGYGLSRANAQGLVLAKGFIADMPKVIQASYIVVDYKNAVYENNRFILWGEPVVQGNIIQNRFFNCFLQRSGG